MVNNKSFTLIEILVVVSIIVLFSGITLAAYNNYTEEKKLEADARKIVDVFELARKKANSADASLCDRPSPNQNEVFHVGNFTVAITSENTYQLRTECTDSDATSTNINYFTKTGILFSTDTINKSVIFHSGDNKADGNCILLRNDSLPNTCRYIKVDNYGIITNGKNNCSSCP